MKKIQKPRKLKRKSKIFDAHEYEYLNWKFPLEPPLKPGDHGLPKDHYDHTHETNYESICGGMDDSQDVELYDGTLGVPIGFVQNNERPVGQIQWNNNLTSLYDNAGNVNNVRWCTGTLISPSLFLTAGHCFGTNPSGWVVPRQNGTALPISSNEIAINMHVNFNYQFAPNGTLRNEESFPILDLTEYRLGGLDFAIVRLGGDPGDIYGFTGISKVDANNGDMLCIIQHPAGVPKRIDAGSQFHLHDVRLGYDSIDTLGGSSGSGVLRESTGLIVGVHTHGGCSPEAGSHNHGQRITSIISNSPTIQGLLQPKFKFVDDPINTFKFVDDPVGTFKFADDPIGTLKFVDDPIKPKFTDNPIGTLKQIDDVKQPGYDKNPATDFSGNFGPNTLQERTGSPFILSTPHHSNVWGSSFPDAYQSKIKEYEQIIPKYESELKRLDDSYKANQLNINSQQQFEQLISEYQQIISEYKQLIQK